MLYPQRWGKILENKSKAPKNACFYEQKALDYDIDNTGRTEKPFRPQHQQDNMLEIITENKKIVWVIAVFLFTILMLLFIQFLFRKIIARAKLNDSPQVKIYQYIRRLLRLFFVLIGVGLMSYTFFEEEMYDTINAHLQRIIWISAALLGTLIGVALAQNYFQQKIDWAYTEDFQDPTGYKFMKYLSRFFIYLIGFSLAAFAIPQLKFLAQTAMTGAGMLALIAGIASQEAISNLVGGAFIVVFKPFKIGQTIQIGSGIKGVVEDLTLRHTVIRDFQNQRVIIPNSVVNKEYITNFNMGDPKTCEWLELGIGYSSDVDLALSIMREEAEAHPNCIDNRTEEDVEADKPLVDVRVIGWGDSSVNLRAYIWAKDSGDAVLMRHQLFKSVKNRFEAAGIEIPFPHRTLVHQNLPKYEQSKPEDIGALSDTSLSD